MWMHDRFVKNGCVGARVTILMGSLCMSAFGHSASGETPPDATDYRISAEDVLQISVWKEEGLEKEVVVRPDGGISFPLAGDVPAAGKTPVEVEAEIAQRLQRFIPDAVVTVSVMQLKGLRIYVSGKVRSPGQFTVGRYVDVLQAITLAGGLTPFANEDDIKILRRENGKEVVYKFNYGDVRSGKKLDQNILLQTDDVVVVP
jgi:Periplasmic protein involved in polysaccharide export